MSTTATFEGPMSTGATSFLSSRRGALTLGLLVLVQFLDFLDVSIVNVELPSFKQDLHFSEQSLQRVVSGYVLTYGGFLLLGGRAADLVGRRRVLVGGLALFAAASLIGGGALAGGADLPVALTDGFQRAFLVGAGLVLTGGVVASTVRTKGATVPGRVPR